MRDKKIKYWKYPNIKRYEINYIDGKKDGKRIKWNKNGNKIKEIDYIDDEKNGKEIIWYQQRVGAAHCGET